MNTAHVTSHATALEDLAYGARDVANAPAIKKSIKHRSTARNDNKEISDWLSQHFTRYVIGNLATKAVEPIRDIAHAQTLFTDVPDWLKAKISANRAVTEKDAEPFEQGLAQNDSTVWWVDVDHASIVEVEHTLIEFLKSRTGTSLEGKLMRVNCMQALALWQTEHESFLKLQEKGWQVHHPDAVQLILEHELGCFYEMQSDAQHLRAEMAYESQFMQHCLGQFANKKEFSGGYGEYYAEECKHGRMRLFSFRSTTKSNSLNPSPQPRITISAMVQKDGSLIIEQVKGKQNRPPVKKYHRAMLSFLNHLNFSEKKTHNDVMEMNIVRLTDGWHYLQDITKEPEQLALMQQYPDLLNHMNFSDSLLQWLALVHAPTALKKQQPHPSIVPVLHHLDSRKT